MSYLTKLDEPSRFLRAERFSFRVQDPATGVMITKQMECLMRPDSVAILLQIADTNQFVFAEQARIGPATKTCGTGLTIEPVAGMVDEGETPEAAARREAVEEVGVEVTHIEPVTSFWMCPGVSNERMHLFYGRIDSLPRNAFGGCPEEQECIRVLTLTPPLIEEAISDGRMLTAHGLLLWQWAQLKRKPESSE